MSIVENLEALLEDQCPHCGKETGSPAAVAAPKNIAMMPFVELAKFAKQSKGTPSGQAAQAEVSKRVAQLKKLSLTKLRELYKKYSAVPEVSGYVDLAVKDALERIQGQLQQQSLEQLAALAKKYEGDKSTQDLISAELNRRKGLG
jgi:hypothetical protein